MNDDMRVELERMLEADQARRKEIWGVVQQHDPSSPEAKEAWRKGAEVDERNLARLVEILDVHGWPGTSTVGEAACKGAFLVLQHADLATQKKYLPLLREATAAGEMDSTALPLLEDRVRMREGRDQLYGSQLVHGDDGKPKLWPIEDEAHVDERRARSEPLGPPNPLRRVGRSIVAAVILFLATGTWGRAVRCGAARGSHSMTAACRWRTVA